MKKLRIAAVTAAVSALAVVCSAVPAAALNVQIVNESGKSPDDVCLLLHNGSSTDGQLPAETPVKLSALTDLHLHARGHHRRSPVRLLRPAASPPPSRRPTRSATTRSSSRTPASSTSPPSTSSASRSTCRRSTPTATCSIRWPSAATPRRSSRRCWPSQAASGRRSCTARAARSRASSRRSSAPTTYPQMTGYLAAMAGKTIHAAAARSSAPRADDQLHRHLPARRLDHADRHDHARRASSSTPVAGQPLVITGRVDARGRLHRQRQLHRRRNPAQVADNDVYAVIYRDVAAGFALGLLGRQVRQRQRAAGTASRRSPLRGPRPRPSRPTSTSTPRRSQKYSDSYGFSFSDVGPDAGAGRAERRGRDDAGDDRFG